MRNLFSRSAWWIAALAVLLAFAGLGSRGIWDPDEGRYSNVALQMLDSGDWINPQRSHDTGHWTKPPLTYWAIGGSVALFGQNFVGGAPALGAVVSALCLAGLALCPAIAAGQRDKRCAGLHDDADAAAGRPVGDHRLHPDGDADAGRGCVHRMALWAALGGDARLVADVGRLCRRFPHQGAAGPAAPCW